jgi:hypothetical protein
VTTEVPPVVVEAIFSATLVGGTVALELIRTGTPARR